MDSTFSFSLNDGHIIFEPSKTQKCAFSIEEIDLFRKDFNLIFEYKTITVPEINLNKFLSRINKFGFCKLCQQERVLHKKSHIIPKFMFRPYLINERNKLTPIHKVSKGIPLLIKGKEISSQGYFERDILCLDCEAKFSKLETYYATIVHIDHPPPRISPRFSESKVSHNATLMKFENVDKVKFKLFLLSILWRCSISKIKVLNEAVKLNEYENVFRRLLNNPKDIKSNIFPFIAFNSTNNPNWDDQNLMIGAERDPSGFYFKMIFGPLIFFVNISSNYLNDIFMDFDNPEALLLWDLPKQLKSEDSHSALLYKALSLLTD